MLYTLLYVLSSTSVAELLQYKKKCKFLGVTLDDKLSLKDHIEEIVSKCKKRLNLLKALCGKNWGATPETILYTYRCYIRPVLEYSSILFAYAEESLLKRIQAVETLAIKIAHRLPPWTTNHFCYSYVTFEKITDRIKKLAKDFLNKNANDVLIKPLIDAAKPSINGQHSAVYKTLNW